MAFCVGVMSLTTVSCTKEIEQDIADLKGQVADLAKKIADLEARLTTEVNTLNTAIAAAKTAAETADAKLKAELEAKIAVVNVEQKDGNVVLTLGDGSKITVAVPDANANNTNLVTTVTENGVTYWAVIGADGKAKSLGVEVGHPDVKLSFKVNAETNELLVSYDGVEYEGTGVLVKDPDTYKHVVTAFEDGEDYVKLTIGEVVYTLPKYVEDNASLVLGRTDFFLMYGANKTVSLTADGISEYYVMAKPDGWKAVIEGTTLTVTAPAETAAEVGAAELEGDILVHATTEAGKCKVAKLSVKTGVGLTFEIDREGNVTITNAYTSVQTDELGEETITIFANMYMGLAPVESFMADPVKYVETINDNWNDISFQFYNLNDYYNYQYSYVEVENEVNVVTVPINDLYYYGSWQYEDMPYGSEYVLWTAPCNEKGEPMTDALVYETYSHLLHQVEVASVSHNEVTINANVLGASKFYVGMIDAWFEDNGFTIKDYVLQMGPWMYIQEGMIDYAGMMPLEGGEYKGETAIKLSEIWGEPLAFDTKYYFWVFPYYEDKEYNDYDAQFAPYIVEVTTSKLQAGGTWAAEIETSSITYTSVAATITPQEGTTVYYKYYTPEAYATFADDAAVVAALFEECMSPVSYEYTASARNLTLGTSRILATVAVGEDGKYGELITETLTTTSAPTTVNENNTAEFTNWAVDFSSIKVTVTPATGTTAYYAFYTESAISSLTETELVAKTISGCYSPATAAKQVSKTAISQGTTQVLVVVVTDSNNTYKLYKETKTTLSYPYDENITIELASTSQDATTGVVTAVFNVTGADKFVAYNYYSGFSTNNFEKEVLTVGATQGNSKYIWKDVVDGKVTIEFTPGYYMTDLHATAYTVTDGTVSAIAAKAVLKDISEYVED